MTKYRIVKDNEYHLFCIQKFTQYYDSDKVLLWSDWELGAAYKTFDDAVNELHRIKTNGDKYTVLVEDEF